MVKKWIIIASIFVALVVSCVLEYRFVNGSFDSLQKSLQEFRPMLEETEENIDQQENIEYISDLHETWHKKVDGLKALIWHTGLKEVENGLSRVMTYTKENDYTEAMTELNALIDYVQHYSADFDLSLSNLL